MEKSIHCKMCHIGKRIETLLIHSTIFVHIFMTTNPASKFQGTYLQYICIATCKINFSIENVAKQL